jgi:GNAT superfamily N-acetyltransferase
VRTRTMTKADFDQVVSVIDHWWGGPGSTFAQPVFFHELGRMALVAEEASPDDPHTKPEMAGFLLGFVADDQATELQRHRTGYVYLVGIHPQFRRRGVGRLLYQRFTEDCIREGCSRMKAITTPGHDGSIRFHLGVGWEASEQEDYAGPGRKRIVFVKDLQRKSVRPGDPAVGAMETPSIPKASRTLDGNGGFGANVPFSSRRDDN